MDMSQLTLCGQVNMKNYTEGGPVQERLEEITRDPMRYNTEFLMDLIRDNKDTEFGKAHGFSEIRSVEDFQKKVPLTTYDDYAGYIYRMAENGEKDLITVYDVMHYAKTSGTMGNPKKVPVSTKSMGVMDRYNIQLRSRISCDALGFGWINPPAINLIESQLTTLKSGATYGAISAKVMGQMGPMLSQLMTSPLEAMVPDPTTNTRYLHARFALARSDITYAGSSFASIMLEMMEYIRGNWEMLVNDIANGTIDESVKMPDSVRESVLSQISPMPERAAELRAEFEKGFDDPIGPRIWPNLTQYAGVATGGFAIYHKKLMERYLGPNVHTFYVGLNASEGTLSVPFRLDDPDSVLLPDAVFYEFLPIGSDDPADAVTMDKVVVGEVYEIVITNMSGFYRYRIRDAVRITGFHNATPTIQFQYRIDQTISVLGEKTTEYVLRSAAEETEREMGYRMTDFSVYGDIDGNPLGYVMLMEAEVPEGIPTEDIAARLDEKLCAGNQSYGDKRAKGMMAPLRLLFLQPETYLLYRDLMVLKGASSAQLKPPRVIMNEVHRRFFLALLEE